MKSIINTDEIKLFRESILTESRNRLERVKVFNPFDLTEKTYIDGSKVPIWFEHTTEKEFNDAMQKTIKDGLKPVTMNDLKQKFEFTFEFER